MPLSAYEQNKVIPSMAVLALFIVTIDGIAYFAIAIFIFSHLSDIIYLIKILCGLKDNLCEVHKMSDNSSKVFEDEFMEVQSGLISLCMEFIGENEVDKVYAYGSIEDGSYSFNVFFEVNGEIKNPKAFEPQEHKIFKFLNVGTLELTNIEDVCTQYNKPVPTEIKLYYDVKTGKFNAHYKYEPICVDKCAGDVFDEWMAEIKLEIGQS